MQFALQLAGVAAQEIMPRFQHSEVEHKADGTPVTEADTESERVMRQLIRETFPDHGIMGEEQADVKGPQANTLGYWIQLMEQPRLHSGCPPLERSSRSSDTVIPFWALSICLP